MSGHVLETVAAIAVAAIMSVPLVTWVGGAILESRAKRQRRAEAANERTTAYSDIVDVLQSRQADRDAEHELLLNETLAALDEALGLVRAWAA